MQIGTGPTQAAALTRKPPGEATGQVWPQCGGFSGQEDQGRENQGGPGIGVQIWQL